MRLSRRDGALYIRVTYVYTPDLMNESAKLTWRFRAAVVVDAVWAGGGSGAASGAASGATSTAEADGMLDGSDHADDPIESVA